jgi:hypothetical protein
LRSLLRYGFDIDIHLWQPTTLITVMDVHESQRDANTWESGYARLETFFDDEGNKLRRLTAGPGVLGMKLAGFAKHSGTLDDVI